jgi:hypothetical protein
MDGENLTSRILPPALFAVFKCGENSSASKSQAAKSLEKRSRPANQGGTASIDS